MLCLQATGRRGYWDIKGKVTFEGKCILAKAINIQVSEGAELVFKDGVTSNVNCLIVTQKHIEFGSDCMLGWGCTIMDNDAHSIVDMNGKLTNPPHDIIIGDHVWIAAEVTVLKGSVIPSGSVVATKSVVSKDFSIYENSVIAGNPAKVVREGIRWTRENMECNNE